MNAKNENKMTQESYVCEKNSVYLNSYPVTKAIM